MPVFIIVPGIVYTAKLTIYPASYYSYSNGKDFVKRAKSKNDGDSFDGHTRPLYSLTDSLHKLMSQHGFITLMGLNPNDPIAGSRKSGRHNYTKIISNLYPVPVICTFLIIFNR
jgi:hypothetical protein